MADYLLDDITVLDAATYLAGPGAGTILADFGADVIKIEPPGGDGYRNLVGAYPVPYHWLLTSRNKRSLCLDLSKDAGQSVMHKLVESADVFTTNYLPKQQAQFGVTYETLSAINPRLIYAHVSGYGTEGDEANRRAFDVTGWWARSGIMEFIRDPGQTPLPMAPGMGDHSTATAFFSAIMTGLYRREKTGEGSFVSTSLVANGVWANGMALQGVIAGNDVSIYRQAKGWPNPFTNCYPCRDGNFLVLAVINTAREYPQLVAALDAHELLEDERFASVGALMKHRPEFTERLAEVFMRFTYAQASTRLEAAGVTFGIVQPMGDVIHDPQLRANNIVVRTEDAGEGYDLTISSPINVRQAPKKPPQRAPEIGAHSQDILTAAGFTEAEVQALLSAGVVTQFSQASKDQES